MRDSVNPLRDLFDAAVRHRSIKLTCAKCGHVQIVSAHALWWHFQKKGWKDDFQSVQARSVCTVCWYQDQLRVCFPDLELSDQEPTETRLAMPCETDWKRELRRRR